MTGKSAWRTWGPAASFVALAGAWYLANVAAYAASLRTRRSVDAKFIAAGHAPPFRGWSFPSAWSWGYQSGLRDAGLGILGAALIAVLLRRRSKAPWFVLAAALPIVVGHASRIHQWWAAGPGVDQWTSGAGVGTQGLDLSHYGAGPAWTLLGGTVLAVAVVVVPALMLRPAMAPAPRSYLVRALPYVVALIAAVAVLTAALHLDNTGDGSGREMLVAAAAAALFATVAAFVATEHGFWRTTGALAIAAGLVMVSGLNPGAMSSTKWAAFAAAASVATLAALAARRPNLRGEPNDLGHFGRAS